MSSSEILSFLLPGYDPIQLIFGTSMLLLGSATLIAMFWGARPANWERKWNGSGADDLDVEHGSVNEISAAVASTGEKMADLMPGVLLILGLLGTFLGLGIALNKASSILIEANSGGGMDNAMTSLMGMMEGLGTKFKTSTWGLMAFLIIKALAGLKGYEEKRLRWCIGKMKAAFEHSRQASRKSSEQQQQALLGTLKTLDQTLLEQLQANREVLERQLQLSQHGIQATTVALSTTHQAIDGLQQVLLPQLQTLNTSSLDTSRSLSKATELLQQHGEQNQQQLSDGQAMRASLENELRELLSTLTQIAQANTTAQATTHLAIADMQQALFPQLQTLNASSLNTCRSLGEVTTLLQRHGEQNQKLLDDSHATRTSLEGFIEANSSNLGAISDAAGQMAGAAGGIGQSANQLQTAIGEFKSSVSEVLDGLKRDLAETIGDMGESFAHNMSNISTTMAQATSGISNAVSDLSVNVGKTMTSVQQSNDASMAIQKNAHVAFIQSSDTLNEKIEIMKGLVEDLRERIVKGLQAVSESNRNMASLTQRNDSVVEHSSRSAEAINQLVEQLKSLQLSSPLQPAVERMIKQVDTLGSSLSNIDQHISMLQQAVGSSSNGEHIGHIRSAMQDVIEHLKAIDYRLNQVTLDNESA